VLDFARGKYYITPELKTGECIMSNQCFFIDLNSPVWNRACEVINLNHGRPWAEQINFSEHGLMCSINYCDARPMDFIELTVSQKRGLMFCLQIEEEERRNQWEHEVDRLVYEGGADPGVYDVFSAKSTLRKLNLTPKDAASRLIDIYFEVA